MVDVVDPTRVWADLTRYRQRYEIEDRLEPVSSLERSIARRRSRETIARKRLQQLELMVTESRRELEEIEREILESQRAGAALVTEILDEVRRERGEVWTPALIRGFRVWSVRDNTMHGNAGTWTTPSLEARCLREVPNEDIPHAITRCGPPGCGIYATKSLGPLPWVQHGRVREDHAVGVVGLSGKVIEHEKGFRGARAIVLAVVVRHQEKWLKTDDTDLISWLFHDPSATLRVFGRTGYLGLVETSRFLEEVRAKEERWISEVN